MPLPVAPWAQYGGPTEQTPSGLNLALRKPFPPFSLEATTVIIASAAGGKWSEPSAWVGGVVPGESNDVVLGPNSGNITITAEAKCRSLNASEYKNTLKLESAITLRIGTSSAAPENICYLIGPSAKISGHEKILFSSSSGQVEKIFPNSSVKNLSMKFENALGKWILEENIIQESSSVAYVIVTEGELNLNGFAVGPTWEVKVKGGKLVFGKGKINAKKFEKGSAGSVSAAEGTVEVEEMFEGGSETYGTVIITKGSSKIIGKPTIKTLELKAAGETVSVASEAEITITGTIIANGKSGSLVKWESETSGKVWKVIKTSGIIILNYLELRDSHASGGAEFYAGANSVNVSGNEGWIFTNPVKTFKAALTFLVGNKERGTILDSFTRANEKPIANGWSKLAGETAAELVSDLFANGFSYWTSQEYTEPTVVAEVAVLPSESQKAFLITCIGNPTGSNEEWTGYQAELEKESGGTCGFWLTRKKSGEVSGTSLGGTTGVTVSADDLIAITVSGGVVKFWHSPSGGSWVVRKEAADTNFTKGFAGLGAELSTRLRNFGVGPIVSEPFPVLSVNHAFSPSLSFLGLLRRTVERPSKASLSFLGLLERSIHHDIEGYLSFVGVLPRVMTHTLQAELSPVGYLFKTVSHVLSGSVSFLCTLPRNILHNLSASLSFLVSLTPKVPLIIQELKAALSFAGSVTNRRTTHELPAGLTFLGSIGRGIYHDLEGHLSFVGSLTPYPIKTLMASLTPKGYLDRNIYHQLRGSVSFLGELGKFHYHQLSAALSFKGSLQKYITHQLSGALSFFGNLPRNITHQLQAELSFASSMTKDVVRRLAAALSFEDSIQKYSEHALEASLSFVGSLPSKTKRPLKATLPFMGAMTPQAIKTITAELIFAGYLGKNITHWLKAELRPFVTKFIEAHFIERFEAILSFAGVLHKEFTLPRTFPATLDLSGELPRYISHELSSELAFVGNLSRKINRSLEAAVSFVANMPRRTTRRLVGGLTFEPEMSPSTAKALLAVLAFSGRVNRSITHPLEASQGFSVTISRTVLHTLRAALNPAVEKIHQKVIKNLEATLESVGYLTPKKIHEIFIQRFQASISFAGSIANRKTIKPLEAILTFIGKLRRRKHEPRFKADKLILYTEPIPFIVVTKKGKIVMHALPPYREIKYVPLVRASNQ